MVSFFRALPRHFSLRQLRFKTRMIMILGAITLIQTVGLGYFALHYLDLPCIIWIRRLMSRWGVRRFSWRRRLRICR